MPPSSALARRRRSRGHTQESLAERLGVDVSSVARWERGISTPSPGVRRALAGELAVTLDDLAALLGPASAAGPAAGHGVAGEPAVLIKDIWDAAERDDLAVRLGAGAPPAGAAPEPGEGEGGHGHAVRVVHQWLITPPPPARAHRAHGRPRRIGATDLDGIRGRLRYLHRTDDTVAGGDLYPAVRDELARTAALLRTTSYSAAVGRGLLRLLAELCGLAGWSAADAGDEGAGVRHHVHGIKAAHAADASVLAAQLVSSLGYHLAEHGHGRDAVTVTRSALARLETVGHGAPEAAEATPAVRALLHARTAWAHAVAGEPDHADEALRRAEDAYGARRAGTDPDPAWAYWLTPDEMQIVAGRLDIALGRPRRGGDRIGAALAGCDPRRVRETVLYTAWLAHSHLRRHEHGAATELARHARRLNGTIRSVYADRALDHLTLRLTARRPSVAAAPF
jgi:transcriptional regulator with XRE-family HTH domain